jgi:hypothetical protein
MPIIREKLRSIGQNLSLRIGFDSNNDLLGYQQEIDNLSEVTTLDLVNPVIDVEERKFKLNPNVDTSVFSFYFYNGDYNISFINAGFTQNEINARGNTILNSFFILDFYDTYDVNTQTRIFRTYLTKIGNIPQYTIKSSTNNQLYYWYVPVSYIEQFTGSTVTGYTKFTFYNAKTGKITLFYNLDNQTMTTPEKMYFKSKLNLVNKTWELLGTSSPYLNAKQLINETQYNNKINNTVTNINNIKQDYPTGDTYSYIDNNYFAK